MASPIRIVSDQEAETADFVVCMRAGSMVSPFADNEVGVCSHCGHAIFFRPNLPKTPPKICAECAADLMRAHGKPLQ